jgi:hemerythrin superfamily protein
MDAVTLLERDHKRIAGLLKPLRSRPAERKVLETKKMAKEAVKELGRHADLEEQLVFPVVRENGGEEAVFECLEDHDLLRTLLQQLEKADPEEERYRAKVTVLIDLFGHHAEREEGSVYSVLKDKLTDEQRKELGERLEQGAAALESPTDYLNMG